MAVAGQLYFTFLLRQAWNNRVWLMVNSVRFRALIRLLWTVKRLSRFEFLSRRLVWRSLLSGLLHISISCFQWDAYNDIFIPGKMGKSHGAKSRDYGRRSKSDSGQNHFTWSDLWEMLLSWRKFGVWRRFAPFDERTAVNIQKLKGDFLLGRRMADFDLGLDIHPRFLSETWRFHWRFCNFVSG